MRTTKLIRFINSRAFGKQMSYKARKRDNELSQRCVQCPNLVEDGHACCQDCRAKAAAGKRAAREQGLCVDCWTVPVVPGKRYCATHANARQHKRSDTYTVRVVRRRCVQCGKARAQKGLTRCKPCATRHRGYAQKRRRAS